ncbi:lytic transglycosylase domain-containing protein, partial [Candidatus Woesearchaeota archaeon]|nr:lytic transglycosylase domain-containing protein [Candidatus Woesearchaeota archaeon]
MDMSFENIVTGAIVIIVVLVSAIIMYQFYPDVKDQVFSIANDVFNIKENADQVKIEEQALKNAKELVGNIKNMFETCKYDFNCNCSFKINTEQTGENKIVLMQNGKNIDIILFDKSDAVLGGETITEREINVLDGMGNPVAKKSLRFQQGQFWIEDQQFFNPVFVNFKGKQVFSFSGKVLGFETQGTKFFVKDLKTCEYESGLDEAKKEVMNIVKWYDSCKEEKACEDYTVILDMDFIISHAIDRGFHLYHKVIENEITLEKSAYKDHYFLRGDASATNLIFIRHGVKLNYKDPYFYVAGEKINVPYDHNVRIFGKAIDEDGDALKEAVIELYRGNCKIFTDYLGSTTVGSQIFEFLGKGSFEITIPDGVACLTAMHLEYGRIYQEFNFDYKNTGKTEYEITVDFGTWAKFSNVEKAASTLTFDDSIPEEIYLSKILNKPGTVYNNELKYSPLVYKYAKLHNVNFFLIKAIIQQESKWNPNAISPTGATGLMQLTKAAAKDRGLSYSPGNDERFIPEKNIDAGIRHLKFFMNQIEKGQYRDSAGDILNTKYLLAAYNHGTCGPSDNGKIGALCSCGDIGQYCLP